MDCRNTSGGLRTWMCQSHLCLFPLLLLPPCFLILLGSGADKLWEQKHRRKTGLFVQQVTPGIMTLWPQLSGRWGEQKGWKIHFSSFLEALFVILYHICLNKDRKVHLTKDQLWLCVTGNILFLQHRQKIKTDFPLESSIKAFGIFHYKALFIGACCNKLKGRWCAAC